MLRASVSAHLPTFMIKTILACIVAIAIYDALIDKSATGEVAVQTEAAFFHENPDADESDYSDYVQELLYIK